MPKTNVAAIVNQSNAADACCCMPIKGPRGLQGPPGRAGVDGKPGPRGERGLQGLQGPRGLPGGAGTQGGKGENGRDGVGIRSIEQTDDYQICITLTDEKKHCFPLPQGPRGEPGEPGKPGAPGLGGGVDGDDGKDGVGISDITQNDNYEICITLTNGDEYCFPLPQGPRGEPGEPGKCECEEHGDDDGEESEPVAPIETKCGKWIQGPEMWCERVGHATQTVDSCAIVVGGFCSMEGPSQAVFKQDGTLEGSRIPTIEYLCMDQPKDQSKWEMADAALGADIQAYNLPADSKFLQPGNGGDVITFVKDLGDMDKTIKDAVAKVAPQGEVAKLLFVLSAAENENAAEQKDKVLAVFDVIGIDKNGVPKHEISRGNASIDNFAGWNPGNLSNSGHFFVGLNEEGAANKSTAYVMGRSTTDGVSHQRIYGVGMEATAATGPLSMLFKPAEVKETLADILQDNHIDHGDILGLVAFTKIDRKLVVSAPAVGGHKIKDATLPLSDENKGTHVEGEGSVYINRGLDAFMVGGNTREPKSFVHPTLKVSSDGYRLLEQDKAYDGTATPNCALPRTNTGAHSTPVVTSAHESWAEGGKVIVIVGGQNTSIPSYNGTLEAPETWTKTTLFMPLEDLDGTAKTEPEEVAKPQAEPQRPADGPLLIGGPTLAEFKALQDRVAELEKQVRFPIA